MVQQGVDTCRPEPGPAFLSMLHRVQQLAILLEDLDGFHRRPVQEPAEREDHDGESDLPCARRIRTQPDQRQRQRPHAQDRDDDGGSSEMPFESGLFPGRVQGTIEELAAVLALDRLVLDIFGAKGTLFHYRLY